MLRQIISGGQTGADRAALDAASDASFPHGGFCPKGRLAEDGSLDERYQLAEINGGYKQRTRKNAETSDGTVIFYQALLEGGTEQTVLQCIKLRKPYKLIDIDLVSTEISADKVIAFIAEQNIRILNVAGPRASKCPAIYPFVKITIGMILSKTTPTDLPPT